MSSSAQRLFLIGLQTVAGTGVNVDVALRTKGSFKAVPEKVVVDEDIGSYAPARHYIGALRGEGSLDWPGYFEHAPYIVSMALGDGAVVAGAPDTWTFAIPDTTPDTFALYTVEYTDGGNHIVRCIDVFATALEISGEAGKAWIFKPTLVGGTVTFPAAVSATVAPPVGVNNILMADTKVYLDATYAGIGVTEMPMLVSFSWKLENFQHQKQFAGSLAPSGRGNDKWKITLELIMEVEHAVFESEKEKLLTTAQTAIQIKADPGTPDMTIKGMFMLNEIDSLDDRDGNNIIKCTYLGEKDASNNTGSIVITTELNAL